MKLVMQMGYIYRMSDRNYRRLLRAIAADAPWDLDTYGRLVGGIDKDVTDLDAEQARDTLAYDATRRPRRTAAICMNSPECAALGCADCERSFGPKRG